MLGSSIGINPQNSAEAIAQLQEGLPLKSFTLLKDHLNATDGELANFLGIPVSTLVRRKKENRFTLRESERIFRIARLFDKAVEVFEDNDLARKWLREPAWGLGDIAPIDYARTEIGAREVEDLLGRIDHGVYS